MQTHDELTREEKNNSKPPTIILQIWDSVSDVSNLDTLLREPGPKALAAQKAKGGNTGHVALVVQQELAPNALPEPSSRLDSVTFIQANKVIQQQRFSFNPDAGLRKILQTKIHGSVQSRCAKFAEDSGLRDSDDLKRKQEDKEELELRSAEEYLKDGKMLMNELSALIQQKANPGDIILKFNKLLQTLIPDPGGDNATKMLFKVARASLIKNMLTEICKKAEEYDATMLSEPINMLAGLSEEDPHVDLNESNQAWLEQNKHHFMVKEFYKNCVFDTIMKNMQSIVQNRQLNEIFVTDTLSHLVEVQLAKRMPVHIDVSFLNRFMDARQLQTLMQDALKQGYSVKDNTCIQATLNIIAKGLEQSNNPEALEILANLVEQNIVVKGRDGQHKINHEIVNTPTRAYLFVVKLKACCEQINGIPLNPKSEERIRVAENLRQQVTAASMKDNTLKQIEKPVKKFEKPFAVKLELSGIYSTLGEIKDRCIKKKEEGSLKLCDEILQTLGEVQKSAEGGLDAEGADKAITAINNALDTFQTLIILDKNRKIDLMIAPAIPVLYEQLQGALVDIKVAQIESEIEVMQQEIDSEQFKEKVNPSLSMMLQPLDGDDIEIPFDLSARIKPLGRTTEDVSRKSFSQWKEDFRKSLGDPPVEDATLSPVITPK